MPVFQVPSYAPDDKPIEKRWKHVHKEGPHLQDLPTFAALRDKVEHALLQFAKTPEAMRSRGSLPTELTQAA